MKKINLFLLFLFFCSVLFSFQGDYGTESVFSAGAGARAEAMGGAYTAIANDTASIFYNPAGLALIQRQEVVFLHTQLYENTTYDFVAYTLPVLEFGILSSGIFRFYSGIIEGFDESDKPAEEINLTDYKLSICYSNKIYEKFYLGTDINIFNRKLTDFNAFGFGLNAGLIYTPFDIFKIGFVVQNLIKPTFVMKTTTESLGQRYILAFGFDFNFNNFGMLLDTDLSIGENENFKIKAGTEINWAKLINLRAGFNDGLFTFGGGIFIFNLSLDYAYINNDFLGPLHKFSVLYKFGQTLSEQQEEKRKKIFAEVKKIVDEKLSQKIAIKSNEYYKKAYEFYKQGDFETALQMAEKSFDWNPQNENAKKMIKFLEEKIKEKIINETKVEFRDIKNEKFISGINYYIRKRFDKAVTEWEKALQQEPDNKIIRYYINKIKPQTKQKREIIDEEQKKKIESLYYEGVNEYTSGNLKKAVFIWQKILLIDPENIKTLRNLEKVNAEIEELEKRGIK
jgi:tetratricopeptide (TPR) repeat protein